MLCLTGSARAEQRPRVLLLPLQIHATEEQQGFLRQGLRSMFVSRLSGEGLDVVSEEETVTLLSDAERQGVVSEERAGALARKADAPYVVFGSVTALGGSYSLDLSLLDLEKDPPKRTRISETATEDRLIPKLGDLAYQLRGVIEGVDPRRYQLAAGTGGRLPEGEGTMGLFFSPTAESYGFNPKGYSNMRARVVSLATGDLDGDGGVEIVMATQSRLIVASREGDTLALKDTLSVRMGETFLRVSAGDMDGDGKAEIYLVGLYGKRAQSTVYTWEGRFRRVLQQYGHLNLVRDAWLNRQVLLYQGSEINTLFSGDIHTMAMDTDGTLERRDALALEDVQLYTLAYADLNRDGISDFLGLDQNGHLHLWDESGTVLWKGSKDLGGSNNVVEIGERSEPTTGPLPTEINGRVIVADIDGDGTREVVAAKNIPNIALIKRMRVYKRSRLIAYKVENSTLEQAWTTREIQYAIADLQQQGGTIYVAAHKGEYSKMSSGSSRILWFE
jgi:TolB-like protein